MGRPSRVRVTGPLEPYASGFREELARQGYRPHAASNQLQLMAHAGRWLASRELGAGCWRADTGSGRRVSRGETRGGLHAVAVAQGDGAGPRVLARPRRGPDTEPGWPGHAGRGTGGALPDLPGARTGPGRGHRGALPACGQVVLGHALS